jgi:hypothetical protein
VKMFLCCPASSWFAQRLEGSRLLSTKLHGITSQKTIIPILSTVGTSNPIVKRITDSCETAKSVKTCFHTDSSGD